MLGMFLVLFVFVVWASVPGKTLAAQYETGFVGKKRKRSRLYLSAGFL